MNWIRGHFRHHLERPPWDFCWRIGVEHTVLSLMVACILFVVVEAPRRELLDWPMGVAFAVIVLVAPPLETLLCQALPIFLVRILKGPFWTQVLVSTGVFAALHFPEGVAVGVSAGLVGGLYYGFAYAHWRTQSRWQALWITTVCHGIRNGLAFLLLVIFGNWS